MSKGEPDAALIGVEGGIKHYGSLQSSLLSVYKMCKYS